jgi:hypothetical protein
MTWEYYVMIACLVVGVGSAIGIGVALWHIGPIIAKIIGGAK